MPTTVWKIILFKMYFWMTLSRCNHQVITEPPTNRIHIQVHKMPSYCIKQWIKMMGGFVFLLGNSSRSFLWHLCGAIRAPDPQDNSILNQVFHMMDVAIPVRDWHHSHIFHFTDLEELRRERNAMTWFKGVDSGW